MKKICHAYSILLRVIIPPFPNFYDAQQQGSKTPRNAWPISNWACILECPSIHLSICTSAQPCSIRGKHSPVRRNEEIAYKIARGLEKDPKLLKNTPTTRSQAYTSQNCAHVYFPVFFCFLLIKCDICTI